MLTRPKRSGLANKEALPIAADPIEFPDLRIFVFFGNCGFGEISNRIWGLGTLQSMGNGCGLQTDGFSADLNEYEHMFDDCSDFC